jgi:hypothetical protein
VDNLGRQNTACDLTLRQWRKSEGVTVAGVRVIRGAMNTPAEQEAELSDVELVRRAVTYSRPCGFEVVEKWRTVASLFSVGEAAAQS